MSESWENIFREMLSGSISTVLNLLKVMVPLMILTEVLMAYNVVEKLAKKLEGIAGIMGMSRNAVFPLMVGIIMGVSYGAGTIMEINNKSPLSKKDMTLFGIFIFMCHGIIETGMLFGIAGASVIVVTLVRLLLAFVVTVIAARTRWIRQLEKQQQ